MARREPSRYLRLPVRDQISYFWRHFPICLADRRIAAYLIFDLIDCTYRGAAGACLAGVGDGERQRRLVCSALARCLIEAPSGVPNSNVAVRVLRCSFTGCVRDAGAEWIPADLVHDLVRPLRAA